MSDYEDFETNHPSVDLSGFDDDFATAEAPEYDEVPDGKYQARIESQVEYFRLVLPSNRLAAKVLGNHWLDCLVGASVVASMLGCVLPGTDATKTLKTNRLSFRDLQHKKRN